MRNIDHFIGGGAHATGERQGELFDPNSGSVQAKVGFGTAADLDKAVTIAVAARPGRAATNPHRRARVRCKFKEWLKRVTEDVAPLRGSVLGITNTDDTTRGTCRERSDQSVVP